MLSKTKLTYIGALALVTGVAGAQSDEADDYMIEITEVQVKAGHMNEFMEGVKAYRDCYAENDGQDGWSFWRQVDGDQMTVHVVSRMDKWAELDETDEVSAQCWESHSDKVTKHTDAVETTFATNKSEWSGDPGEYTVVELHNFKVEDDDAFEKAVSDMTGTLKEAEYDELGTWYDIWGGDGDDADYFVVGHYANFADMDDRSGGMNAALDKAKGEEERKRMWEAFGDALKDDGGYWRNLLQRVESLSYEPGSDS